MIDGESLDALLERRGRLPWETALEYGQSLAEALQLEALAVYGKQATGEKFLINPNA